MQTWLTEQHPVKTRAPSLPPPTNHPRSIPGESLNLMYNQFLSHSIIRISSKWNSTSKVIVHAEKGLIKSWQGEYMKFSRTQWQLLSTKENFKINSWRHICFWFTFHAQKYFSIVCVSMAFYNLLSIIIPDYHYVCRHFFPLSKRNSKST